MNKLQFPIRLVPRKDLWVHKNENGTLLVKRGINGKEMPCLSETERVLFDYLCAVDRGELSPILDTAKMDVAVLADLASFSSPLEWFRQGDL